MKELNPFVAQEIKHFISNFTPITEGTIELPIRFGEFIDDFWHTWGDFLSVFFYVKKEGNKLVFDKFVFEGVEYSINEFLNIPL